MESAVPWTESPRLRPIVIPSLASDLAPPKTQAVKETEEQTLREEKSAVRAAEFLDEDK